MKRNLLEEKATLLLVLDWAKANCTTECISIYSDSQALLKAIRIGAHDTQSIRLRLDNRESPANLMSNLATRPLTRQAGVLTTDAEKELVIATF